MNNFLKEVVMEYACNHEIRIKARNSKLLLDLTEEEMYNLLNAYDIPLCSVNFKTDYDSKKVYMEVVVEWDEEKLLAILDD